MDAAVATHSHQIRPLATFLSYSWMGVCARVYGMEILDRENVR